MNPNYPDGGGYYYYGYRFYDPNLQRWLNRDPLGEAGGINLYAFLRNRANNAIDPLGESDNNRPPIIIIGTPGGPITPIYGPPKPEPGVYPGSGSPHEALERAGFLDPFGLFDALNTLLYASAGDWGNAGISLCGVIPYAGDAAKTGHLGLKAAKAFSSEKQALVDMAKRDKRKGITEADMQAYKDLNKQLPDPFPGRMVRGPEKHDWAKNPTAKDWHGHVGLVDYIPIKMCDE